MSFDAFGPVPQPEINYLIQQIRAEKNILDLEAAATRYRAAGLIVDADAMSRSPVQRIQRALLDRQPYSLIRIGDGEVSFLTLGRDQNTPILDFYALEQTVKLYPDRFQIDQASARGLQIAMREAVETADCVGVVGLWRTYTAQPGAIAENIVGSLKSDLRGWSGHWRAIRHMLHLAEQGALANKLICSAHIYFGLTQQLPELISAAERTLCITNRLGAVKRLRQMNPTHKIDIIRLSNKKNPLDELPDSPVFLDDLRRKLPENLSGCLVLIGAGSWAELYANWVKERGGVAIDLGSGFDLLNGKASRPIHRGFLQMNDMSLDDFLDEKKR